MVDPFARKGYRLKGIATVLADGPQFEEVLALYRRRGVRAAIQHVVLIAVHTVAPLRSPAYDDGSSEDEIRAKWRRHYQGLLG